jgi:hypothetical protein
MLSESIAGAAKLCAKRGVACLVSHGLRPLVIEEPDGLIGLVRVCGEGGGQPLPLPGRRPGISRQFFSKVVAPAPHLSR